ncbi:hypothetical protein Pyn_12551 [Prunus yedoensis var. nudiflora]|uniref:Uncharacterized protein n=1 Tax=Prunus yedoensis var. nudiflora TaxID=2094558 RepID=A0A314XIC0_PRUYE|nr:hypothetical protein Pyn_12551 [Prunus yedoensis var. nudiflora]
MGLTNFANTGDGGNKGNRKIEVEGVNASGNTGNVKALTDFANSGKVNESGRQEQVKPQK